MTITNRVLYQKTVAWRDLVWFQSEKLKSLSPAGMDKLKSSIRNNQFVQPFNVWDDGNRIYILDGHHRQKAMRELEAEGCALPSELPANFIDCRDRRDAGKMVLLYSSIYAKIAGEGLAEFTAALGLDLDELAIEIDLPDFDIESILSPDADIENIEEPPTPEPQATPITKRGDIYGLGRHRLLCGDSSNADDVARLMNGETAQMLFTDPPYNLNYANFNADVREGSRDWQGVYCNEWSDSMTDVDYAKFLVDVLANAKTHLAEYAHYYVWHAISYYPEICRAFDANDISYDKLPIIWVKNTAPVSWAHYKRRYELCFFGGRDSVVGTSEGGKMRWQGGNGETNVWEEKIDHNNSYVHPTQKPVALPARAIANSSKSGEIVLELFGGSGSTLLAAEQLNRIAYVMEYDPAFSDVIVRRYIGYCQTAGIPCVITKNGVICDIGDFDLKSDPTHGHPQKNAA